MEEEATPTRSTADGAIATAILVLTVISIAVGAFLYMRNLFKGHATKYAIHEKHCVLTMMNLVKAFQRSLLLLREKPTSKQKID